MGGPSENAARGTRLFQPILRPELLYVCALFGLIGSVAPTALNIVASIVAEHDFVADTISDLGRGPNKWIMDTGFYLGASGLIGLAIGSAHAHLGGLGWTLGIFILAATALVNTMIGLWDQFGQGQDLSVHTRLTFLLGPLYFFGPLVMLGGLGRGRQVLRWLFIAAAVLWLAFATAFKFSPTEIDGLLEKVAVLATLLWTIPLSILLWRTADAARG